MGRRLRIQSPGTFQHITARGNDRQTIFYDSEDFETYLDFLDSAVALFEFEVHAYCLMPNHLHLLCRFPQVNMGKAMGVLQGRYARHFNRRYGRVGHLFEKRYSNRLVLNEEYLHEVGRYIHNNPVKDGLSKSPEEYPWSSFCEIWESAPVHTAMNNVLRAPFVMNARFDPEAFRSFTKARIHDSERDAWYEASAYKPDSHGPHGPFHSNDSRAQDIITLAIRDFNLDVGELSIPSHSPRLLDARAFACHLLRKATLLTLAQIGAAVGLRYPTSVLKSLRRAKNLIIRDPLFAAKIERGLQAIRPR